MVTFRLYLFPFSAAFHSPFLNKKTSVLKNVSSNQSPYNCDFIYFFIKISKLIKEKMREKSQEECHGA